MDLTCIKEISPLHEYWESSQNDNEEKKRLLKVNPKNDSSHLLIKEPYKWETLFQSIIREIIKGDDDSLKGLKVLLNTLNKNEQNILILKIKKKRLFSESILYKLKSENFDKSTKKNIFRFLKIMFNIFSNPYCIEIKRERLHLYEKTGWIIYSIRKKMKVL